MRTLLALTAILALSLMMLTPADAMVRNISLSPVGDEGVSGTATTITGQVTGERPYTNVEVNIRMNTSPPENMVYEAWFIDTDTGFLNSLGVMDGTMFSTRQTLAQFEPGTPYNAIAVSLEPVRDTDPMPTTVVSQGILPGTPVAAADFPRTAVLPPDEMLQRQIVMQRYMMPQQEITQLRIQGWNYQEIAILANAAVRCNKPVAEVTQMRQQGQTWEQIAQACGITVATLLEPATIEAVAGFRGELPPDMPPYVGVRPEHRYYRQYATGRPVVTRQTWEELSRRGYSWQEVAMAANVAASTGERIGDLLRMTRIQGLTWRTIALQRGLNISQVMDLEAWPFERNGAMIMPPAPPPAGATY